MWAGSSGIYYKWRGNIGRSNRKKDDTYRGGILGRLHRRNNRGRSIRGRNNTVRDQSDNRESDNRWMDISEDKG